MGMGSRAQVGVCENREGKTVAVKTMKRRIFAGSTCEQIVYNLPEGTRNPKGYDPEQRSRKRFKDEADRERHKVEISRRSFIRLVNTNMEPGDLYATLTFDNDWEVHTFEDARRVRYNYIRTLIRKYPDAVIFAVMGRGKSTERIHFHLLIKGIPEEFISQKWKYGKVKRIVTLRAHCWYDGVDHGADYTGIANYMFDHWTPDQGGHRWFQTKTAKQPEKETPTEVRITGGYSEKRPPIAPKGFKLVSVKATPYGCVYFKYVRIPPKDQRCPAGKKDRRKSG